MTLAYGYRDNQRSMMALTKLFDRLPAIQATWGAVGERLQDLLPGLLLLEWASLLVNALR